MKHCSIESLSDGLISLLQPAIALLARYLASRMAAGAFMAIDPVVAARGLLGQAFAHFLQCSLLHHTQGEDICWNEVTGALTMLFLQGMLVRGTTEPVALIPEEGK